MQLGRERDRHGRQLRHRQRRDRRQHWHRRRHEHRHRRQRGPGSGFPTQACLDKANGLLAQMTLDEKAAQTIQAERAQITNAQVMQYGVGSIYSQGGSAPSTNTPAGWAAMIAAYRTASRASAHGIPIIYGLDSVHGLGPVAGATVFPHNVGLGAIGDPALIEQVTRVVADESAGVGADFPFAPVVAVGARRALGTDLRGVRRDARPRCRRWALRWSRACSIRRAERRSRSSRTSSTTWATAARRWA